jgi:predicted nucleotidyltransferase
MTNPDSVVDEEVETKAIEKWLRMVDKPLATKKGDRKDMNLEETKKMLRKWASENADICRVYIYGSRARGNFDKSSDLDVAVELDPEQDDIDSYAFWISHGMELERELQSLLPYKIQLEYYSENRKELVKDIVRGAIEKFSIAVYSRDENSKKQQPKDEQKQ